MKRYRQKKGLSLIRITGKGFSYRRVIPDSLAGRIITLLIGVLGKKKSA